MNQRRVLPALLLSAMIMTAFGACSPFGDDDDDDPTPRPPTATIEVIMSTFTPTEVVSPADKTATGQAEATFGVQTATARALLPTPTPFEISDEEDALLPPQARLESDDAIFGSSIGSFAWQFSDVDLTFADIDVPLVPFAYDPVEIPEESELRLSLFGEEFRSPPQEYQVTVYDFDENSSLPIDPQGGQPDEPLFTIQTGPSQQTSMDPANPTFRIIVAPGHYAIRVIGFWGPHPALADRSLFVTWIFNVEVV